MKLISVIATLFLCSCAGTEIVYPRDSVNSYRAIDKDCRERYLLSDENLSDDEITESLINSAAMETDITLQRMNGEEVVITEAHREVIQSLAAYYTERVLRDNRIPAHSKVLYLLEMQNMLDPLQ